MAKVVIRFYEELNDFISSRFRKRDIEFDLSGRRSVKDLIESYGVPHVEVDLILVNGEAVGFDYLVQEGDRISVYPVFERLDIAGITGLRQLPLREPRFIVDVNLGRLAKYLRILGMDVMYGDIVDDAELARVSSETGRILLTLDKGLLMRKIVTHGMLIRNRDPKEQCIEVIERLDLWRTLDPFSRCIRCNGLLEEIHPDDESIKDMRHQIPSKVWDWCHEYSRCTGCGKIYWKGSHYEAMEAFIKEILNRLDE